MMPMLHRSSSMSQYWDCNISHVPGGKGKKQELQVSWPCWKKREEVSHKWKLGILHTACASCGEGWQTYGIIVVTCGMIIIQAIGFIICKSRLLLSFFGCSPQTIGQRGWGTLKYQPISHIYR